jgi:hypothetical protein
VTQILTKLLPSDYKKATLVPATICPACGSHSHPTFPIPDEGLQDTRHFRTQQTRRLHEAISTSAAHPAPARLLVALPAPAAPAPGSGTTIDLAAEASRPATNDLARATVFAEAAGATPSELAKRVNGLIADGLKTARSYSSVKTQSGATYTYPVYGKGGKIESWRMRSDLTLECSDPAALSELLGKLQASLGVASLACCQRRKPEKKPKMRPCSTPSRPSRLAPG